MNQFTLAKENCSKFLGAITQADLFTSFFTAVIFVIFILVSLKKKNNKNKKEFCLLNKNLNVLELKAEQFSRKKLNRVKSISKICITLQTCSSSLQTQEMTLLNLK